MSTSSIGHYLRDFGVPVEKRGDPSALVSGSRSHAVDEAYARGVEDGQAAARATLEQKLEEQKKRFENDLAVERRSREEDAATLAGQLAQGLTNIERAIGEAVGRVLHPFVAAQLEKRALAELQTALEALLAKDGGVALTISGPEQLLQKLDARLAAEATVRVTFVQGGSAEVRVTANDTILQTRLGAWLAGLEEAMR